MSAEKYSVFDHMIEGVQIISPEYRYVYMNDAVVHQSKYAREDLIGYTMQEKFPGIEKTAVFNAIKTCMTTGEFDNFLNEFNFPDGSIGWFQLRMQRIEEGVLVFSYDITEQKRAEQIIHRTNAELEELVSQRTQELEEKNKIIHDQIKTLEELNSTKDKFFSIIAHDMKSPLHSLKSFATLLVTHIDHLTKSEIVDLSRQFETSLDNTIEMAENLITWAKLQMKDNETRLEKIKVQNLVRSAVDLLNESAERKSIAIQSSVGKDLEIIADKNQMDFVIRNILNNAIKFTDKNGSVSITAEKKSDHNVELVISDDGVGMTKDIQQSLFSVTNTKSTVGTDGERGSGLGLMLSAEFVRLNHGHIDIESEVGKGSSFFIELQSASQ